MSSFVPGVTACRYEGVCSTRNRCIRIFRAEVPFMVVHSKNTCVVEMPFYWTLILPDWTQTQVRCMLYCARLTFVDWRIDIITHDSLPVLIHYPVCKKKFVGLMNPRKYFATREFQHPGDQRRWIRVFEIEYHCTVASILPRYPSCRRPSWDMSEWVYKSDRISVQLFLGWIMSTILRIIPSPYNYQFIHCIPTSHRLLRGTVKASPILCDPLHRMLISQWSQYRLHQAPVVRNISQQPTIGPLNHNIPFRSWRLVPRFHSLNLHHRQCGQEMHPRPCEQPVSSWNINNTWTPWFGYDEPLQPHFPPRQRPCHRLHVRTEWSDRPPFPWTGPRSAHYPP